VLIYTVSKSHFPLSPIRIVQSFIFILSKLKTIFRSLDSSGTPSSSCGSQDSVQKRGTQTTQQSNAGKKKGIKSSIGRLFGKKDKVSFLFEKI